jgi:hypothetical protein
MSGPPVVITTSLGRPVTNVFSERGAVPMVVVSTLGEPVTLVASGGEPVTLLNPNGTLWDFPFSLFLSGAQGAWYDPSDFSTLFQDSAGSTPVTAVEQPVRLMRDKSGRTNHATAPNDASRPVLRARYNLLTFSEQFDNAIYVQINGTISANTLDTTDPIGGNTADKFLETIADNAHYLDNGSSIQVINGATYTRSVYLKSLGRQWIVLDLFDTAVRYTYFDIQNGVVGTNAAGTTASIVNVGNGWYRCSITRTVAASAVFNATLTTQSDGGTVSFAGDVTKGFYIWGAQLLTAADQTSTGGAYQRIAAATSYDTSNPVFRPYLAFDGSDDSFSTSSIDFSGTDKMTVFAGLTKLTNPTGVGDPQVMVELSADRNANNGAFTLVSPADGIVQPTLGYAFPSKGTTSVTSQVVTGYPAPITNVLTGIADISGDVVTLRANGAQIATNTGDQGTGNFGNYPLFIGRRNNTSNPFNGRLYSAIILGRAATTAELTATEQWINGKTGAY